MPKKKYNFYKAHIAIEKCDEFLSTFLFDYRGDTVEETFVFGIARQLIIDEFDFDSLHRCNGE